MVGYSKKKTMKVSSSPLVSEAAAELEVLREVPKLSGSAFPKSCLKLLRSLPGNRHCVDCGNPHPQWASVTYGTLLCMQCSGRHRSYGVRTSFVRSIDMDSWSHDQVLAMLEGGNGQMRGFFDRHKMGELHRDSSVWRKRYRTKAALFYRSQLAKHVERVAAAGCYEGRDAHRQKETKTPTTEYSPQCGSEFASRQRQ